MKTLQMLFTTDFGKSYTFQINAPKETITKEEVLEVMESIVSNKLLATNQGTPIQVKSAKIVDKVETTLFEL